jgi:formylglycine-generating enzyme
MAGSMLWALLVGSLALAACGGTIATGTAGDGGAAANREAGTAGGADDAAGGDGVARDAGGPGDDAAGAADAADASFQPASSPSCAADPICNGESCCRSVAVPGGTFLMGRATEDCGAVGCAAAGCPTGQRCNEDEQPEHPVTVASYALDRYAVTVSRFRAFVNAYVSSTASAPADGAGAHPLIAGSGWSSTWNQELPADQQTFRDGAHLGCGSKLDWYDTSMQEYQTWTADPGGNEDRPVNCVNWYEAFAFCIWDGGRLATEAEWEYAAAGGEENRVYVWGNAAPDCTVTNFYNYPGDTWGEQCLNGVSVGCGFKPVPVGSVSPKGDGRWGHSDMDGNVYEWTLDWYGPYSAQARENYANLSPGDRRVARGGFFYVDYAEGQRAAYRRERDAVPEDHWVMFGFRCARAAP